MKPSQRTNKMRKLFRKLPGGKTTKVTKRRKGYEVNCAICKTRLQGSTSKKGAKTHKHPTRKFAGNLCFKCAERILRMQARVDDKTLTMKDVEPKYKRYVKA